MRFPPKACREQPQRHSPPPLSRFCGFAEVPAALLLSSPLLAWFRQGAHLDSSVVPSAPHRIAQRAVLVAAARPQGVCCPPTCASSVGEIGHPCGSLHPGSLPAHRVPCPAKGTMVSAVHGRVVPAWRAVVAMVATAAALAACSSGSPLLVAAQTLAHRNLLATPQVPDQPGSANLYITNDQTLFLTFDVPASDYGSQVTAYVPLGGRQLHPLFRPLPSYSCFFFSNVGW